MNDIEDFIKTKNKLGANDYNNFDSSSCDVNGCKKIFVELIVSGKNDELVNEESILNLKKRLSMQKNIEVNFETISNANHFYKAKEKELLSTENNIENKTNEINTTKVENETQLDIK